MKSIVLIVILLMVSLLMACSGGGGDSSSKSEPPPLQPAPPQAPQIDPGLVSLASTVDKSCVSGKAGIYPCTNVDLSARLALIAGQAASDIWGWEDPASGSEYALLGLRNQTAFVDVTKPNDPQFIGYLPNKAGVPTSSARDIKVLGDFAYIVSEADGFGMQVFRLTRLRDSLQRPFKFNADATYSGFGDAHNIALNTQSGFAYVVGSDTCSGGAHIVNLSDPLNPKFVACDETDGYTHDAQCVNYAGSHETYKGQEICFNSNEDTLTIVNVNNKSSLKMLSRTTYESSGYSHQGWLTEDHNYFFLGDELDERNFSLNRRTRIFDVRDLDKPVLASVYFASSHEVDHNLYVKGDHVYQANYNDGMSILRFGNLNSGELIQVGHFDTQPNFKSGDFNGMWSVYPYFSSGTVIASDINAGLFVFKPNLDVITRCNDGIDNDGDGLIDFPKDNNCTSAKDTDEG